MFGACSNAAGRARSKPVLEIRWQSNSGIANGPRRRRPSQAVSLATTTMSRTHILYLNAFVIATCGLVYELLAGTLGSYVLGDSVTQFSLCIGVYLSALGVGAWLSRFVERSPAQTFIEVELAVALLGGFSAPLLFLAFANVSSFAVVLYGMVFAIGTMVGLELPLLMRILKDQLEFKDLVSRVLTFDYIGSLAGALLFPLLFVPYLGLVRTSLMFGLLNALVGFWGTWVLEPMIPRRLTFLRVCGLATLTALVIGIIKADSFTTMAEERSFVDTVVYTKTSHYQRIVITQNPHGFQLHLNGNLQFNSFDEYRYHEALVHPAMAVAKTPRRVLVLGGGDGLAVREILRHASVEHVTLVDLDPAMTELSREFPPLAQLNEHALDDPRVAVVNQDAMLWIETEGEPFDAVIIDFPDPNNFALGKLYTTRFYHLLKRQLTPDAVIGIQCTSPLLARTSYWCIVHTMQQAGYHVRPYHIPVPSFGVWGFALAGLHEFPLPAAVPEELQYLNPEVLQSMCMFPNDLAELDTEINRLDNQALVHYYATDASSWQ